MNNFLENLKKYFENTSKGKILEDWSKSAEFDKIGPTVEAFLHHTQQFYPIHSEGPFEGNLVGINEFDPKFTSGFLMS